MKRFTKDQISEILDYAKSHTIAEASFKFAVGKSTISKWRKDLDIKPVKVIDRAVTTKTKKVSNLKKFDDCIEDVKTLNKINKDLANANRELIKRVTDAEKGRDNLLQDLNDFRHQIDAYSTETAFLRNIIAKLTNG